MRIRLFVALLIHLLLVITASCARPPAEKSQGVEIVASFYPLAFVAEEVGGDLVEVQNLTPPGVEPHDLELSPGRVTSLNRADLVIYLGSGFQPSVEEALAELDTEVVDVLLDQKALRNAEPHEGEKKFDPHIWLDPQRTALIAHLVSDRLAKIDSENASAYRANARSFDSKLEGLDKEFKDGLDGCARRSLVTSHEAFGYLAAAYNLEQVGIAGLDPEQEPSPQRLAEVANFVKTNNVTTIYFEELLSPALAETISREAGVKTAKLDPLEGPPKKGDYFTAMRENLDALRQGLGCP